MRSPSPRARRRWSLLLALASGVWLAGHGPGALLPVTLAAQAPVATPTPLARESFEIVSIKPSASRGVSRISMPTNGRFVATNVSLPMLIRFAYKVHDFQIAGGADWMAVETFDIEASRPSELVPEPGGTPRLRARVRQLLADKFKLKLRVETRDMPMYQLVVARPDGSLGPQLRTSNVDCAALAREAARASTAPAPSSELTHCGLRMLPGELSGGGVNVSDLALTLSRLTGRVVENGTGLAGTYDLRLEFLHDLAPPVDVVATAGTTPVSSVGLAGAAEIQPTLHMALQDQLGLRLRPTRGPVDVLVITNVERPKP